MEERICVHCGCVIEGEGYWVGSDVLCDDCASELTAICCDCDERFYVADDCGDSWHFLCRSCYEGNYTRCERCGEAIRCDEAFRVSEGDYEGDDLCESCYNLIKEELTTAIHDYSYRPDPQFHGVGPEYMGVELEVDGAGEDNDYAGRVLTILNEDENFAYCKRDGSLDDGFEIVTHPCTLAVHRDEVPWEDAISKLKYLGYTSHDAGTCGLHIHVSRKAFGETEEEQDDAISRVLYFFEAHWDELLRFSRRTQSQLDRWAARYGYSHNPKDILDKAKDADRYTAVNLKNRRTVEFRMFRGTLKLNTILATLELIHLVCDLANRLDDEEMQELSWIKFVSDIDTEEYPELIQYLKERRVYINEPVEAEAEV